MTPETETRSDLTGCQGESEAGSPGPLTWFITMITVRVLAECHVDKYRSLDEWVSYTEQLAGQVMQGLTVPNGFQLRFKGTEKVYRAVMDDLEEKFCSRRRLEFRISQHDPEVDAAIIQFIKARVKGLYPRVTYWGIDRFIVGLYIALAVGAVLYAIICFFLIRMNGYS